ncbi:MAG: PAS domain S-box protein [Scytolyngbya sp. HA4215-MV1]|jgi:PAS domain S-box-containing protein|nr:PAS domain S-box protein [Scytolyngbya sp. HA4215-MV1]
MLSRLNFRPKPYFISLLLVVIAGILTKLFHPILGHWDYLPFFAAILLSGGFSPHAGWLAVILSMLAIDFLVIPPLNTLQIEKINDGIELIFFSLIAILANLPSLRLARAQRKIQALLNLELQESEQRLKMALQAAQMGIWDCDFLTGKAIWSPETERLFGLAPGSFDENPETFYSAVHPDDRAALIQAMQQSIESGCSYQHQYRGVLPDGSIRWIESTGQTFYDADGKPIRMMGTAANIDARQRIESALRKYEGIVSSTSDGIALLDRHYTYQIVNQTYLERSNKSRHEIVGHTIAELFGAEVFANIIKSRVDRCLAGETISYEEWFDYPHLGRQFLSVTYSPYLEADGAITGVVVNTRNLTDLKQAELALQEKETFLRSIYEGTGESIFVMDVLAEGDFRFAGLNPTHSRLTGIANEDLLGKAPEDVMPPKDAALVRRNYQSCVETGSSTTHVEKICFGGQDLWWITNLTPLRNEQNQIYRLIGTSTNITELKQTETALRDSEERLRSLVQDVAVGIFIVAPDTEILMLNQMAVELLGRSASELLGKKSQDIEWYDIREDGSPLPKEQCPISLAIVTRQPIRNHVVGMYRPAYGDRIWALINSIPQLDAEGEVRSVISSFSDITALKAAESALHQQAAQEQAFNRVVQTIRNSLDLATIFSTATREFAELLQLDSATIYQYVPERQVWVRSENYLADSTTLLPSVIEIPDQDNPIAKRLRQGEIVVIEDVKTLDDPINQQVAQQIPGAWLIVPLEVDGKVWGCLGSQKISPTKPFTHDEIQLARRFVDQLAIAIQQAHLYQQVHQLNQQLEQQVQERTTAFRQSRDLFEAVFQESADAIFLVETDSSKILDCNQRAIELFEADSKSDLIGIPGFTLHKEPFLAEALAEARSRIEAQGIWSQEIEYATCQGRNFWGSLASKRIEVAGQQMALVRVTDISDRKQTELHLQRQAEADHLLATIAQTINQSVQLDEVLMPCLEQVRHFLHCDRILVCHFDASYNVMIELESVAQPALSLVGNTIQDPCFGQAWAERYRCGYTTTLADTQTDEIAACHQDFLAQLQVRANLVVGILQADKIWGVLIAHHCTTTHQWQPAEIDLFKQLGFQIGIATQKANLYKQLEHQLAQKEILLKEIHHRVKNNLQVISSMLWLQIKAIQHPTVSTVLADTRSRLQAMALIHETLHQSGDLGQLNFSEYIQRLGNSILSAHSNRSTRIHLTYRLQPIALNLETAIPCGLLLNELITNAIKHAFPHQPHGEIYITLEQKLPALAASPPDSSYNSQESVLITERSGILASPYYVLSIQDNGVGIAETVDLKHLKSLGLKIAYDLALQLRGHLALDRTHGTRFELTFSALNYRQRF